MFFLGEGMVMFWSLKYEVKSFDVNHEPIISWHWKMLAANKQIICGNVMYKVTSCVTPSLKLFKKAFLEI